MYFGTSDISTSSKNGDFIYSYTAVYEIDSEWQPFFAKVKSVPVITDKRKLRSQAIEVEDPNEETVRPRLERIPFSRAYPLVPKTFLRVKDSTIENCYIKPVDLSTYRGFIGLNSRDTDWDGKMRCGDDLLAEAAIYEVFRKSPHPNVLQYDGCVVRDGRMVALALPKLCETLRDRVLEDQRPIDGKKIYNEISAAIQHIHSLGFAHNDLNPRYIMLKEDGTAVLIEFDSCARERQVGHKSPGPSWWCLGDLFSNKEKDLYALRRLVQYLNDPLHREQDSES
jgi:serine/threonine protein kinase